MVLEKNSKTSICILIGIIVIIWLLGWVLAVLYNMKSELKVIKTNSWNAYDSADACYQKVRLVWDDVESIFYKVSR